MFYKPFLDKITHLLDIHAPITKLSIKEKKELEKPWLTKGIPQSAIYYISQKTLYITNSLEAKKQLVKKHSSKNSNITKTLLTNLQESIRQIFLSHFLRNTKTIQRKHGTE